MIFLLLVKLFNGCEKTQNTLPLIKEQPKLINSILNGKLYTIGQDENTIYIVQLKGTAYQMGYAYGSLLKQKIKQQLNTFYSYLRGQAQDVIHLPPYFKKAISGQAENLLKKVLALNMHIVRNYINPRIYQQVAGISNATGISQKSLHNLNIFPQLIKAACSVIGLWGNATQSGQTLHMRALDWDKNNPISKYPLIAVYQPTQPGSYKYANIGYVGLIGLLTGFSEKLSIGQKVWIPPKNSIPTTRYGQPWTYVLRNVMQFGKDLQSANNILAKSHRTCTIHLGVASSDDHAFTMQFYSYQNLEIYDDKNYTYSKNHPKMSGIAYLDKHVQPSNDACVGKFLNQSYGQWNLDNFWRIIGLSHQTGDTQLAVFDLQKKYAYISYSSYNTKNQALQAYKRNPLFVDFNLLFNSFQ